MNFGDVEEEELRRLWFERFEVGGGGVNAARKLGFSVERVDFRD